MEIVLVLMFLWAAITVLGHGSWLLLAALGRVINGGVDTASQPTRQDHGGPSEGLGLSSDRRAFDRMLHALVSAGALTSDQADDLLRKADGISNQPTSLLLSKNHAQPPNAAQDPHVARKQPGTQGQSAAVPLGVGARSDDDKQGDEQVLTASLVEPLVIPQPGSSREPTRPISQVIGQFLAARNIRWIELIAGILVVVCSIGLVISLWNTLTSVHRVVPTVLFVTADAAIFAAGLYTMKRWRLRHTSRAVLVIATLLVPLCVIAGLTAAGATVETVSLLDPLTVAAMAVGTLGFGWLLHQSSCGLIGPQHAWALTVGVAVPTLMLVTVPTLWRWFGTQAGLALLPVTSLIAASMLWPRSATGGRRRRVLGKRAIKNRWLMTGILMASSTALLAYSAVFLREGGQSLWISLAFAAIPICLGLTVATQVDRASFRTGESSASVANSQQHSQRVVVSSTLSVIGLGLVMAILPASIARLDWLWTHAIITGLTWLVLGLYANRSCRRSDANHATSASPLIPTSIGLFPIAATGVLSAVCWWGGQDWANVSLWRAALGGEAMVTASLTGILLGLVAAWFQKATPKMSSKLFSDQLSMVVLLLWSVAASATCSLASPMWLGVMPAWSPALILSLAGLALSALLYQLPAAAFRKFRWALLVTSLLWANSLVSCVSVAVIPADEGLGSLPSLSWQLGRTTLTGVLAGLALLSVSLVPRQFGRLPHLASFPHSLLTAFLGSKPAGRNRVASSHGATDLRIRAGVLASMAVPFLLLAVGIELATAFVHPMEAGLGYGDVGSAFLLLPIVLALVAASWGHEKQLWLRTAVGTSFCVVFFAWTHFWGRVAWAPFYFASGDIGWRMSACFASTAVAWLLLSNVVPLFKRKLRSVPRWETPLLIGAILTGALAIVPRLLDAWTKPLSVANPQWACSPPAGMTWLETGGILCLLAIATGLAIAFRRGRRARRIESSYASHACVGWVGFFVTWFAWEVVSRLSINADVAQLSTMLLQISVVGMLAVIVLVIQKRLANHNSPARDARPAFNLRNAFQDAIASASLLPALMALVAGFLILGTSSFFVGGWLLPLTEAVAVRALPSLLTSVIWLGLSVTCMLLIRHTHDDTIGHHQGPHQSRHLLTGSLGLVAAGAFLPGHLLPHGGWIACWLMSAAGVFLWTRGLLWIQRSRFGSRVDVPSSIIDIAEGYVITVGGLASLGTILNVMSADTLAGFGDGPLCTLVTAMALFILWERLGRSTQVLPMLTVGLSGPIAFTVQQHSELSASMIATSMLFSWLAAAWGSLACVGWMWRRTSDSSPPKRWDVEPSRLIAHIAATAAVLFALSTTVTLSQWLTGARTRYGLANLASLEHASCHAAMAWMALAAVGVVVRIPRIWFGSESRSRRLLSGWVVFGGVWLMASHWLGGQSFSVVLSACIAYGAAWLILWRALTPLGDPIAAVRSGTTPTWATRLAETETSVAIILLYAALHFQQFSRPGLAWSETSFVLATSLRWLTCLILIASLATRVDRGRVWLSSLALMALLFADVAAHVGASLGAERPMTLAWCLIAFSSAGIVGSFVRHPLLARLRRGQAQRENPSDRDSVSRPLLASGNAIYVFSMLSVGVVSLFGIMLTGNAVDPIAARLSLLGLLLSAWTLFQLAEDESTGDGRLMLAHRDHPTNATHLKRRVLWQRSTLATSLWAVGLFAVLGGLQDLSSGWREHADLICT
ncbi:MAG: hypothetical protein AAGD07_20200, partial [Planctomycetota bacterium]